MTIPRAVPAVFALAMLLAACQPRPQAEDAKTAGADAAPPAPASSTVPARAEGPPQATIPEGPDMRPEAVPASEQPCRDQIGEAAATALAEQCRRVSPATRPPCNAANPCALIQGEIDRACALWARDGNPPEECAR